jgi:hypothetical protein
MQLKRTCQYFIACIFDCLFVFAIPHNYEKHCKQVARGQASLCEVCCVGLCVSLSAVDRYQQVPGHFKGLSARRLTSSSFTHPAVVAFTGQPLKTGTYYGEHSQQRPCLAHHNLTYSYQFVLRHQ